MNYLEIDPATGQIHACGFAGGIQDLAEVPVSAPGRKIMPFDRHVEPEMHYWGGADALPKATRPSPHHTFDWATRTWTDPRSLQEFKDAQWSLVKAARDAEITALLVTDRGPFDAGPASVQKVAQAAALARHLGQPIAFTLANNVVVELGADDLDQVLLVLAMREQRLRNLASTLRILIHSATSVAEVQAITWSTP